MRRQLFLESLEMRLLLASDYRTSSITIVDPAEVGGINMVLQFKVETSGEILGPEQPEFGVYLSADDNITTQDYLLGTVSRPFFPGTLSDTYTGPFKLPMPTHAFWNNLGEGNFTIGVICDPTNAIVESNEANNSNVGLGIDKANMYIHGDETITVDALGDVVDGNFTAGQTTLREAIDLAEQSPGANNVAFASSLSSKTIMLSGSPISIYYTNALNVNGSYQVIDGQGLSSIFRVVGGQNFETGNFSLSDLTLTNGKSTTSGGAIDAYDNNNISLFNVDFTNNEAVNANGGAINLDGGRLTVFGGNYSNNKAANGGAIAISSTGSLSLNDITLFENNSATFNGGALLADGDTGTGMSGARFLSNSAGGNGGAIHLGNRYAAISESLFRNNSAKLSGGALSLANLGTTFRNVTIMQNRSATDDLSSAPGGGIKTADNKTVLYNTIVMENQRGTANPVDDDIAGLLKTTSANNLIGNAASSGGLVHDTNKNIVGNAGVGTISHDAVFATNSSSLKLGSLAIDAGDNAQKATNATAIGAAIDMGAFEWYPMTLTISSNPLTYVEYAGPVLLAPEASFSTGTSSDLSGATLTVAITSNANANDRLGFKSNSFIKTVGSDVFYSSTKIGTFTGGSGNSPLVITFGSSSDKSDIQYLLRNITFDFLGELSSNSTRAISITFDNAHGQVSPTFTKQLAVQAVNYIPKITGITDSTYSQRSSAILLAPNAVITDLDAVNFLNAKLVVSIPTNKNASDRLTVMTRGTGATQVTTSSSNITYGGVTVGTFTGGLNLTNLTITFNASATVPIVQAVVRSIAFDISSDTLGKLTRPITFQMTDGKGGVSLKSNATINIVPTVNNAPVVTLGGSTAFKRGATPLAIVSSANVTDLYQTEFAGGKLTVAITTGADVNNFLTIAPLANGGFFMNGNDILVGLSQIGTINTNGGVGKNALIVTLTSAATVDIVKQLVQSIRFKATTAAATGPRDVTFSLTDGDGGISNTATKRVNVY